MTQKAYSKPLFETIIRCSFLNTSKNEKIINYGLSVDHRMIDGAVVEKFLETIKKIKEIERRRR